MRLPFIGIGSSSARTALRAPAHHVADDVHEHGNDGLRIESRIERAPPPHAVGDDHQHRDDAVEIDVARDVAALGAGAEQVDEPALHVGVEVRRDARDLRIAAALRHDLGAERDLLVRLHREMVVRQPLEHREEAAREVGAGELLRDLGAVALGDAGDERFLGGEIAIEVARAHAGLGADVLHRGAMEAGAHKAALRRGEDLGPAVRLLLFVSPTH